MTFERIDFRVGRIIEAIPFPKAKRPAYKLKVDFGPDFQVKQSSAQLTFGYPDPAMLVGKYAMAVTNFAPRNIAGFLSQILVTGFYADDKRVLLLQPVRDDAKISGRMFTLPKKELHPTEEITFDIFSASKIVLGQVQSIHNASITVDLGSEFGVATLASDGMSLNSGDRIAVLHDAQISKLLAVECESGLSLLTADPAVPIGTILL